MLRALSFTFLFLRNGYKLCHPELWESFSSPFHTAYPDAWTTSRLQVGQSLSEGSAYPIFSDPFRGCVYTLPTSGPAPSPPASTWGFPGLGPDNPRVHAKKRLTPADLTRTACPHGLASGSAWLRLPCNPPRPPPNSLVPPEPRSPTPSGGAASKKESETAGRLSRTRGWGGGPEERGEARRPFRSFAIHPSCSLQPPLPLPLPVGPREGVGRCCLLKGRLLRASFHPSWQVEPVGAGRLLRGGNSSENPGPSQRQFI